MECRKEKKEGMLVLVALLQVGAVAVDVAVVAIIMVAGVDCFLGCFMV
jgi:hypothetical protein